MLAELSRGDHPRKIDKLRLLEDVKILRVNEVGAQAVEVCVRRHVMPRDPAGDAAHLALASVYKSRLSRDLNCAHLAERQQIWSHPKSERAAGIACAAMVVTPLEMIEKY